MSIVTACNRVLDSLRDAIQAEASANGSVLLLIDFGKLLEVLPHPDMEHFGTPWAAAMDLYERSE